MRRIAPLAALLLAVVLALPSASGAAGACGALTRRPKRYAHVIWIWMENHNYDQIVGSPDAPYINGLIGECGLASNFHNITHVSLPNYIGAVTGLALADLQQFLLDCNPTGACVTDAPSIFSQVPSWKAYMESMTINCKPNGLFGYAVRHNPPSYLTSLAGECGTFDVPYTELQSDLDNGTLPAFAFVTPNTVNDMHDGPDPAAIQHGDAWLQAELPKILSSAAYQSGSTAVFITFDEGEGPDLMIGQDCANNTTDASCHIATIVVSPYTRPGTVSTRLYNHYSLLLTTERMLGLRRRNAPGLARRARNMRRAFHL